MKRYPVYVSSLARISRIVGAVAFPLLLLAVVAHRSGVLVLEAMAFGIILACLVGVAAILMGVISYGQLWTRGGIGASSATWGIIYGSLAVLPGLAFGYFLFSGTRALDVSTNRVDPPAIHKVEEGGQVLRSIREIQTAMRQPLVPEDIVSRRYRVDPAQLHVAALKAARRSGWTITKIVEPDMLDSETSFEAVAKTPILGLTEDVSVRIRPDRIGTLFDIRSASRNGITGLTDNVDRIRAFYAALDGVLLETYGEIEEIKIEADTESLTIADEEASEEDAERIPLPGFKPYIEDPKTDEELQAEAEALQQQGFDAAFEGLASDAAVEALNRSDAAGDTDAENEAGEPQTTE